MKDRRRMRMGMRMRVWMRMLMRMRMCGMLVMLMLMMVHVLLGGGQELRILQQVGMLLQQGRMRMLQWLRPCQVAHSIQFQELSLLGWRGEAYGSHRCWRGLRATCIAVCIVIS